MAIIRLPLGDQNIETRDGVLTTGDYYPNKDSCIVNGFVEKDTTGAFVVKRPGYQYYSPCGDTSVTAGTTHPSLFQSMGYSTSAGLSWVALFVDTYGTGLGSLVQASNPSVVYKTLAPVAGYRASLGFNPANNKMSICYYQSITPYYYAVANANIQPATYSGSQVVETCFLDGYHFVLDIKGVVWSSGLNDPTTYNALAYVNPTYDIGQGAGLFRQNGYVMAFGTSGFQAYYDAGITAPASPLAPVPALSGKIGMVQSTGYGRMWAQTQSATCWIGKDPAGTVGVFQMTGSEFKKVSTYAIDRLIAKNLPLVTNGYCSFIEMQGHELFVFGPGWVYDLSTGMWHIFNRSYQGTNYPFALVGTSDAYMMFDSRFDNSAGSSGWSIYRQDNNLWQDNGNPINTRVVTQEFQNKNNEWKFLNYIDLIGDIIPSDAFLRWTDDDYQTYSGYNSLDLSTIRTTLYRLGRCRRRSFELLHTDNIGARFNALEVEFKQGKE